jgi:tetratricopeptide (TPR) repeat protein
MVLQDCAKALAINQNSVKGLYRSATALYSLGRFVEAIDCIDRCLVIDSDNEHVKALRVKAAKSLAAKQGKDEVRAREEKAKADAQSQIQKALKVSHLCPCFG